MQTYTHRVQYYETDMMGVVHHANYLHWMEEARIDFMDRLGFPYAAMEAKGVLSPVKALSCEYRHSCTFPEEIAVRVSVESFNGVVLAIRYEMRNAAGETVCLARSEHVFLNREGRLIRLRREMPEFCAAVEGCMAGENDPATHNTP